MAYAGALKALNGHSGAASSQKKLSRKDRIKQKKARKAATVRADSDEDAAADSGACACAIFGHRGYVGYCERSSALQDLCSTAKLAGILLYQLLGSMRIFFERCR